MSSSVKPLKWYRELADKKGRLEAGAFLVEGDRAIRQIIALHPREIMEIITVKEPDPVYYQYPLRFVSENQFAYFSAARTPQGIAAVVRIPADIYSAQPPPDAGSKILLLEDIQDPGNAGTLIRTAAAFDFSGVILTDKCADPLSPKVVQATAGAVLSVWVRSTGQYLELAGKLQQDGYSIIAAELEGKDGTEVLRQNRFILALGNESAGLSQELTGIADYHARIPVAREKAESLNVAVCGGILMYLSSQD